MIETQTTLREVRIPNEMVCSSYTYRIARIGVDNCGDTVKFLYSSRLSIWFSALTELPIAQLL
jgi:hypothetical protein